MIVVDVDAEDEDEDEDEMMMMMMMRISAIVSLSKQGFLSGFGSDCESLREKKQC